MEEKQLNGKTIALLATDGFEDSELVKPMEALQQAGAKVCVISNKAGEISGKNGTPIQVEKLVGDVAAEDYDGLLLPGGVGNPDVMRMDSAAVEFIRGFSEADKIIAAICHAPWLLIEAGLVKDRKVTSWPSLKTDLINAGADWVDEEVVSDGGVITSRNPDDIPAFSKAAIEAFSAGEAAA